MLSRITISNLVIVKSLDLACAAGMTALTGETGAGKSILIDALGLALGDKADDGMIRGGADRAEISVCFELPADSPALAWLEANDLGADGECLLRRVLVREGRGRAYVNGTPTPLTRLRELGELLLDIHGQHAHQSLLRGQAQRQLLDAYAGIGQQVRQLGQQYQAWRSACTEYDALQKAGADRANRLDYLRFQIQELDGLTEDVENLPMLEAEQARLAHAERLLGGTADLLSMLSDDERALDGVLRHAIHRLDDLLEVDPTLEEIRTLLDTASIQIDEAASGLRHYQDRIDLDPERLAQVDDRLGRVHDAARKHHVPVGGLHSLLTSLQEEAASLENADDNLIRLERQRGELERAYVEAAQEISKARQHAARRLCKVVTESMQTLGMRGGVFDIECTPDRARPGAHGFDRVAFLVAANPGQPEAPLSGVASGGELSRISLAIQVATADCGSVPTLIFDEVDVGIGGAVAEIVGQLLRQLGSERQVLCVTHLAQVASQAHQHMRVSKMTDGKTTETRIEALDDAARIDEVARMLGGVDITEQTRRHADEMIQRAQKAS